MLLSSCQVHNMLMWTKGKLHTIKMPFKKERLENHSASYIAVIDVTLVGMHSQDTLIW